MVELWSLKVERYRYSKIRSSHLNMTRGERGEDIETWSLKFYSPPSLVVQSFRSSSPSPPRPPVGFEVYKFSEPSSLLAQQYFQSPPFGCLHSPPPPPPGHIKLTFAYFQSLELRAEDILVHVVKREFTLGYKIIKVVTLSILSFRASLVEHRMLYFTYRKFIFCIHPLLPIINIEQNTI